MTGVRREVGRRVRDERNEPPSTHHLSPLELRPEGPGLRPARTERGDGWSERSVEREP